jgi:hypothetical protein
MAAPRISVMTKRKQSCENWPPIMSPKRKILKAKSWHRASPQTKEAAD